MLSLSNITTSTKGFILTFPQLEQALKVSEQDVKDASSGVLRDLKRFQKEKEDDLRSYMVCPYSHVSLPLTLILTPCRLPMHDATLTGRARASRHGQRPETKSIRLLSGSRVSTRASQSMLLFIFSVRTG